MDNQLDEVMIAILDGKYSWACVLWLQARGYNPKEYIPCRTYNRLVKQQKIDSQSEREMRSQNSSHGDTSTIVDLPYLENSQDSTRSIRGGFCSARAGVRLCKTLSHSLW